MMRTRGRKVDFLFDSFAKDTYDKFEEILESS